MPLILSSAKCVRFLFRSSGRILVNSLDRLATISAPNLVHIIDPGGSGYLGIHANTLLNSLSFPQLRRIDSFLSIDVRSLCECLHQLCFLQSTSALTNLDGFYGLQFVGGFLWLDS